MAVTQADVDKIIQYDATVITDVPMFIANATTLATRVIGAADDLVVLYLAAHLIGISDPRVATSQVKSLLETVQYKLSEGLGITHYGTMAMQLDSTGKLASWNRRVVEGRGGFQLFWGGTDNGTD
jgi:hypothetical protein